MCAQEEPVAQDEVDLVRLYVVRELQGEHDDMDEAVRRLDLRALVALHDVLGNELVEIEQACDLGDLHSARGGEVDPDGLRAIGAAASEEAALEGPHRLAVRPVRGQRRR